MKILCPTDLRSHSRSALSYAISLADSLDAELHIMTVYSPSSVLENTEEKGVTAENDEPIKLSDYTSDVDSGRARKKPILVEKYGTPASAILHYAKEIAASMIVMGSQGNTTLVNRLLGSVAEEVATLSTIPVFVIPADSDFKVRPDKLLLALDNKTLEHESSFAIPLALSKVWNSKIDLVHVRDMDEKEFPFDPFVTSFLGEQLGEILLPTSGDVGYGLMQFVLRNNYDVLIMVKRERSFLTNLFRKDHITEELLRTFVPVLIIQE